MTYTNSDNIDNNSCELEYHLSFSLVLTDKLWKNVFLNKCEIEYVNWFLWELWKKIKFWTFTLKEVEFYLKILSSILNNKSIEGDTKITAERYYVILNSIK